MAVECATDPVPAPQVDQEVVASGSGVRPWVAWCSGNVSCSGVGVPVVVLGFLSVLVALILRWSSGGDASDRTALVVGTPAWLLHQVQRVQYEIAFFATLLLLRMMAQRVQEVADRNGLESAAPKSLSPPPSPVMPAPPLPPPAPVEAVPESVAGAAVKSALDVVESAKAGGRAFASIIPEHGQAGSKGPMRLPARQEQMQHLQKPLAHSEHHRAVSLLRKGSSPAPSTAASSSSSIGTPSPSPSVLERVPVSVHLSAEETGPRALSERAVKTCTDAASDVMSRLECGASPIAASMSKSYDLVRALAVELQGPFQQGEGVSLLGVAPVTELSEMFHKLMTSSLQALSVLGRTDGAQSRQQQPATRQNGDWDGQRKRTTQAIRFLADARCSQAVWLQSAADMREGEGVILTEQLRSWCALALSGCPSMFLADASAKACGDLVSSLTSLALSDEALMSSGHGRSVWALELLAAASMGWEDRAWKAVAGVQAQDGSSLSCKEMCAVLRLPTVACDPPKARALLQELQAAASMSAEERSETWNVLCAVTAKCDLQAGHDLADEMETARVTDSSLLGHATVATFDLLMKAEVACAEAVQEVNGADGEPTPVKRWQSLWKRMLEKGPAPGVETFKIFVGACLEVHSPDDAMQACGEVSASQQFTSSCLAELIKVSCAKGVPRVAERLLSLVLRCPDACEDEGKEGVAAAAALGALVIRGHCEQHAPVAALRLLCTLLSPQQRPSSMSRVLAGNELLANEVLSTLASEPDAVLALVWQDMRTWDGGVSPPPPQTLAEPVSSGVRVAEEVMRRLHDALGGKAACTTTPVLTSALRWGAHSFPSTATSSILIKLYCKCQAWDEGEAYLKSLPDRFRVATVEPRLWAQLLVGAVRARHGRKALELFTSLCEASSSSAGGSSTTQLEHVTSAMLQACVTFNMMDSAVQLAQLAIHVSPTTVSIKDLEHILVAMKKKKRAQLAQQVEALIAVHQGGAPRELFPARPVAPQSAPLPTRAPCLRSLSALAGKPKLAAPSLPEEDGAQVKEGHSAERMVPIGLPRRQLSGHQPLASAVIPSRAPGQPQADRKMRDEAMKGSWRS